MPTDKTAVLRITMQDLLPEKSRSPKVDFQAHTFVVRTTYTQANLLNSDGQWDPKRNQAHIKSIAGPGPIAAIRPELERANPNDQIPV